MGFIANGGAPPDEHLAVHGLRALHRISKHGGINGNVAPAEDLQALLAGGLPPDALDVLPVDGFAWHEELAHAIVAGGGKLEADALGLLDEEAVRDLQHEASAVARLGVRTHGTAMLEVLEDGKAIRDHAVALLVVDVGDQPDAAGIVFVARVIKTMRLGKSLWPVLNVHGRRLSFFLVPS